MKPPTKGNSRACPVPSPLASCKHFPYQEMGVVTSRDDVLTLVHPGRRIELFREPMRASELMSKYPRHCIARPDVFEFPWIVVHPQAVLPRGCVFFLVPYHTIHMLLKSRQRQQQQQQHHHHHLKHSSRLSLQCLNHSRHNSSPANTVRGEHQESCDAGNPYKLIRRFLGRNMNEEAEESGYESAVDSSPRPRVTSGELIELLRLKSCLSRPDSERRKLNLRVTFADPERLPMFDGIS